MTAATDDARPGQTVPGGRDGTGRVEPADEVDMAALAGSGPPPEGMWLWATEVDGEPGGVFTARHLPASAPRAYGGDVVLRLGPGPGGCQAGRPRTRRRTRCWPARWCW